MVLVRLPEIDDPPPVVHGRDAEDILMDKVEIQDRIKRIIRNELEDCERAIRNQDNDRARRDLDDAVSKLKRLTRV